MIESVVAEIWASVMVEPLSCVGVVEVKRPDISCCFMECRPG
jgi:hypothetical protein